MEVHFPAEMEKKIHALAAERGQSADELVRDAVAGLLGEFPETRQMLDSRYDDIESGRVELVDGEEAFARIYERFDGRTRRE